MKVALVYDRVNKVGGAERVLQALHEIWPDAPLYTSVYNPETAPWASDFRVVPSFLQNFPWARTRHELYPWLTPLAFESFDFSKRDVVISITSAEAKGIITRPKTLHLCYCLTPTRYLWSGCWDYRLSLMARLLFPWLRLWDQTASSRPDVYVAISKTVAARIKKYYRKEATVIYPPVDVEKFKVGDIRLKDTNTEEFFLVVSRLVDYKRVDIAIEAFNRLGLPLKIIGSGTKMDELRRLAKGNIQFLGQLTDKEVLGYYQKCQAVIFPQEEDFGLVPLEAQACGKPIIAYREGGALETVVDGKTGIFFSHQTVDALEETVKLFKPGDYRSEDCRQQAEKFASRVFKRKFQEFVEHAWKIYSKNICTS